METVAHAEHARYGDDYEKLKARPDLVALLRDGAVQHTYVASILGCSPASVSRAWQGILTDGYVEEKRKAWRPSWSVRAMLPTWRLRRIKEMGPSGEGTEEFEQHVDYLVRAYSVFSRFFFRLEGRRPIIKGFHKQWIRSIIVAYAIGGKQLILSPPRHGKSEMLVRFVVWLISMEPNIRIMWVAASGDVAQIMLGAIKDHLENNEELIAAVLPPGDTFRPDRNSGRKWTNKEIKIRQQSHVGQKSSSVIALGRTSKILSRDVDLLVTDDIEDFDTTRELSQRIYSRNKLAEVGTRKEELTAWLYISSRQHADDIPAHIMKLEGTDQAWRTIVNTAHSEECGLDPDEDYERHVDCMLFPEVRTYRWLMEKKYEMEALGIPGAYEMRYLNQPIPEDGIVFDVPLIREKALDRSRDLGIEGLPPGHLVAGLDPAARGTQAAFCWHYKYTEEFGPALSMVDLEVQHAGGFAGAHDIMRQWNADFGLTHWFYEENAQQVEFFEDPRTKELILELGLVVKPYSTGANKTDPEIGISSMAPWYHGGRINLPYGTATARKKVNMLLRQLELWTTDGISRGTKRKTDIKMASWFPFPTIIKFLKRDRSVTTKAGPEMSYPGISSFQSAPWGATRYPGG